jgi:hypothetical protein|tara:strand:- start:1118 stop:1396 length:279 start_codon:yes stop_codon:yes gene_type:complete
MDMGITVDLTKSKAIFKTKVREAREPLFAAQDVLYQRAIEADDDDAKAAVVTAKAALRDAPAAAAIANASDITKLKAAWNTSLLGAADWIES